MGVYSRLNSEDIINSILSFQIISMDESVCIICNKADDKQVYAIKKAALNRLVVSSKKRIDNKYKKFETLTSAFIHRSCQSQYNDETAIATFCSSRQKKSKGRKRSN